MRRRIGTCLLVTLMLVALAVPAFAAGTGISDLVVKDEANYPVVQDGTDKLVVTVNKAQSGSFYLIMAQNSTDVPKDGNIFYIDQKTKEDGALTFTVYPNTDKMNAKDTYHVYLSSSETGGTRIEIASFKYQPAASAYTLGDVDNDGAPTATDAQWILQAAVGGRPFDDTQKTAGDVDHDGAPTATDAQWILQAAVGGRTLS